MKEVNKGFEFFYRNLSNRRKFIRTIWLTILGIFISVHALVTVKEKGLLIVAVILFAIIAPWQLIETYRRYKADCSNNDSNLQK